MSDSRSSVVWRRLERVSTRARVGMESGAIALAWLAAAPIAYEVRGSRGIAAAGVAALLCWLGTIAAVLVSSLFRGPSAAMYSLGLAMFARTALPLAVGVTLHATVPSLANAGMIYYLLAFYLIALATDTAFAVAQIPRGRSSTHSI